MPEWLKEMIDKLRGRNPDWGGLVAVGRVAGGQ